MAKSSITANKNKKNLKVSYLPQELNFNSHINLKEYVIGNKSKPQKRWQLTHRQVEKVLKKLLPYLRNKDKIKKGREVLKHYAA